MLKFLLYCIFRCFAFLAYLFYKKRKAAFYLGRGSHLSVGISAVRFFALAATGIKDGTIACQPVQSSICFREEKDEKAVLYRFNSPFGASVLLLQRKGATEPYKHE